MVRFITVAIFLSGMISCTDRSIRDRKKGDPLKEREEQVQSEGKNREELYSGMYRLKKFPLAMASQAAVDTFLAAPFKVAYLDTLCSDDPSNVSPGEETDVSDGKIITEIRKNKNCVEEIASEFQPVQSKMSGYLISKSKYIKRCPNSEEPGLPEWYVWIEMDSSLEFMAIWFRPYSCVWAKVIYGDKRMAMTR